MMNNTLDNKPKINTTPITCYAHFRRERERESKLCWKIQCYIWILDQIQMTQSHNTKPHAQFYHNTQKNPLTRVSSWSGILTLAQVVPS